LKLVKLPAERGLINANASIEDGELARVAGINKLYPNLVPVPEKLVDYQFVAFVRRARPSTDSWASLEPFSVGHIKGWKNLERAVTPATEVTTVDSAEQLFTMLGKNRIDVALYERWMGVALGKQMQMQDLRVVDPPLQMQSMFTYLHKRHAEKVPAIVAALRAIKAEGLYTRFCREKFAPLGAPASHCEAK